MRKRTLKSLAVACSIAVGLAAVIVLGAWVAAIWEIGSYELRSRVAATAAIFGGVALAAAYALWCAWDFAKEGR